jgi:Tol biopolymer transport system component
VDGGEERTLYESVDADVWVEDWSRDGRFIAIGSSTGWRHPRALIVPAAGGSLIPVAVEGTIVDEYHLSPDARWLAYNSDASGSRRSMSHGSRQQANDGKCRLPVACRRAGARMDASFSTSQRTAP